VDPKSQQAVGERSGVSVDPLQLSVSLPVAAIAVALLLAPVLATTTGRLVFRGVAAYWTDGGVEAVARRQIALAYLGFVAVGTTIFAGVQLALTTPDLWIAGAIAGIVFTLAVVNVGSAILTRQTDGDRPPVSALGVWVTVAFLFVFLDNVAVSWAVGASTLAV
jgi:hypothetical protein